MWQVREHLETCAVCAREFEFEASALQELRRILRRISAPQALMEMERISLHLRGAAGTELGSESRIREDEAEDMM
jgi:hypothetical protein